jgi:protocatechuate 3,4-dioxygenase beta subunit
VVDNNITGDPVKIRKVLDNLSKQTSLEFKIEKRPVEVWFVTEEDAKGQPVAAAVKSETDAGMEKTTVSISGTISLPEHKRSSNIRVSAISAGRYVAAVSIPGDKTDFAIPYLKAGLYDLRFESAETQDKVVKEVKAPFSGLKVELVYAERAALPRVGGVALNAATSKPLTRFQVRVRMLKNLNGLIHISGPQLQLHDVSDAEGRFELELFGPGIYQVEVAAEGLASRWSAEYDSTTDTGKTLTVALTPGATLRGYVTDEQGNPVSGAKVVPLSKAGGVLFNEPDQFDSENGAVVSGADGAFTIEHLAPGKETLKAAHPDYCFKIVRDIELREGATSADTKIVLSRGATVQGHVYDANGRPLAGVTVVFHDASYRGGRLTHPAFASVISSADGSYKVEHLPEQLCGVRGHNPVAGVPVKGGMVYLGVERQAILPVAGQTLTLDFGGSANRVIGGPNRIFGRVLAYGKPDANRSVCVDSDYGSGIFRARAETDEKGEFSILGIPPGRRTLYADNIDAEGRRTTLKTFDVTPAMVAAGKALDLGDLTWPGARAVVKIEDKSNQFPPDQLRAFVHMPHTDPTLPGVSAGKEEPVREEGAALVVTDLPPGRYVALVSVKGVVFNQPFDVREGQEEVQVTVALPPAHSVVEGKYALKKGRRAIVVREDERVKASVSPRGAGYRVVNLPAGEYLLCDEAFGTLAPIKRFKLGEGETSTLDIGGPEWDNPGPGTLTVNVFTQAGLPLPGAKVWLEGQGATLQPRGVYDARQHFAGKPGEYVLHAIYPGYKEARQKVTLSVASPAESVRRSMTLVRLEFE